METVEIRIKSLRAIAKQSHKIATPPCFLAKARSGGEQQGWGARNDSCTVSFLFVCIRG